ncbi:MAG: hypothetical protein H7Y42_03040 [Chitinophagaceae bacterium]|nr:hypothetical protein [Chitinophagaceae bacterium]
MKFLKVKDTEGVNFIDAGCVHRFEEIDERNCSVFFDTPGGQRKYSVPWNATDLIKEIHGTQTFKIVDCTIAHDNSRSALRVSEGKYFQ